jgi:hypothetical protein
MLNLFKPYKVTKIDARRDGNYITLRAKDGTRTGIVVDPKGFSKFISLGGFDPNPVVGDEVGVRRKDGVWRAQWMKEGNLCVQKVKTWDP